MKHPWTLREQFELIDRIAINRMTFEAHFTKTKERIEFSFNGWDGTTARPATPTFIAPTSLVMRTPASSKSARESTT